MPQPKLGARRAALWKDSSRVLDVRLIGMFESDFCGLPYAQVQDESDFVDQCCGLNLFLVFFPQTCLQAVSRRAV